MRGLEGKRVVITGGASGIGAATAQRFIEEGSRVAVVDWNQDSCQKIKAELPGLELVLNADISDVQQVKNAYAQIDQAWGGLDVLINNAGISIRHNFLDITPEEWIKIQSINLNGTFYMAQAAAK
ncbi:MAG: SDR family NAD(P)-dependent oxidoreductase, partial [Anaerolineales bacterium]